MVKADPISSPGSRHDWLLRTKLHIPLSHPNLVQRLRLTDRLNESLSRHLTLISALPGFGKATLLSEWLAAWISLDEGNNDPARFLGYLIAALQTTALEAGETARLLLAAPQPPIESVLTTWVNDLFSLSDDVALILDDYHVIDAAAVHKMAAFLLDYFPPQMHLMGPKHARLAGKVSGH